MPVVIAVVPGWAVGADIAYVVCDMTLASEEHAIFKQTDADVAALTALVPLIWLVRWGGGEIFFLGRLQCTRGS